jgi:hypothetical protein
MGDDDVKSLMISVSLTGKATKSPFRFVVIRAEDARLEKSGFNRSVIESWSKNKANLKAHNQSSIADIQVYEVELSAPKNESWAGPEYLVVYGDLMSRSRTPLPGQLLFAFRRSGSMRESLHWTGNSGLDSTLVGKVRIARKSWVMPQSVTYVADVGLPAQQSVDDTRPSVDLKDPDRLR